MIRFATFLLTLLIAVFASSGVVYAAINPEINYQGKLTGVANNQAVADGDYHMEFKLYTVASGGSPIWTETRTSSDVVAVENGLFSVMLGEVTSLANVDFNQTLYLGVNIGGSGGSPSWDGEMTPRKKIGAVPAAFNSDKLDGLTSADFVTTSTYALPSVGAIGSSSATTTAQGNFIIAGTTRLASSLTGILKATAGYVTTALVDLAADVTGVLGIGNGGTGIATTPNYGELLVGNGSGYTLMSTSSLGITGGSSQWLDDGSNIYFNSGAVAVGTGDPFASTTLTVVRDAGTDATGVAMQFFLTDDDGADVFGGIGAKFTPDDFFFDSNSYIGLAGFSSTASSTAINVGVFGAADNGMENYAGFFLGDVFTVGNSTTTGKFSANELCLVNDCVSVWPAGSSQWDDVTGGINYGGGKVGIGTTTPYASLSVSAEARYGDNEITNSYFTGNATSWTLGANWAYNSDDIIHTPGDTEAVTQVGTLVEGGTYVVTFDAVGGTAGTVDVCLDGGDCLTGVEYDSDTNFFTGEWSNSAGVIVSITPTSDFDGGIDNVLVRRLTTSTAPALVVQEASNLYSLTIDRVDLFEGFFPEVVWAPTIKGQGTFFGQEQFDALAVKGNLFITPGTGGVFGGDANASLVFWDPVNPMSAGEIGFTTSTAELSISSLLVSINDTLIVDSTGYVGIGTSTPTAALSIVGSTVDTTAYALRVFDSNQSNPLFSIRNDGYVGIGSSTPTYSLSVSGDAGFDFVSSTLRISEYNVEGGSIEGKMPVIYGTGEINLIGSLAGVAFNSGIVVLEDVTRNADPNFTFLAGDFSSTGNAGSINYATSTQVFSFDKNIAISNADADPVLSFGSNANFADITLLDVSDTLSFAGASGGYNFNNAIAVGGTATSTFNWNIEVSGDIVPTTDNTYSLGRADRQWKDVFIGPGSLYINGQKVLEEDASNIVVSADTNQSVILKTLGSGAIELNPAGTGNILLKGDIEVTGGKVISTSNNTPLEFEDGVLLGNIQIDANEISATNLNGGISLTPTGSGGVYVTSGNFGVGTTTPGSRLTVQENGVDGTYALQLNNWGSSGDWLKMINRLGANSVEFKQNAGGDSLMNMHDLSGNNNVLIHTNGDSYFNGGNVGIGTSTPDQLLTVGSVALGSNSQIAIDGATNRQSVLTLRSAGVDQWYMGRGDSDILSDSSFFIGNYGGSAQDAGGNSAKFVIGSTGNVGIGTSTPQDKLVVSGGDFNVYASSTADVAAGFYSSFENVIGADYDINRLTISAPTEGVSKDLYFRGGGSSMILAGGDLNVAAGGGDIVFGKGVTYVSKGVQNVTTPYLNIIDGGNVGIGTTSPTQLLELRTASALGPVIKLDAGESGAGAWGLVAKASGNGSGVTGDFGIYDFDGTTYRLNIGSDGDVGIGTTTPDSILHVYTAGSVGRGVKVSSFNPYVTLNDLSGSATSYQAYVDGNLFQLTYGTNSYATEKLASVALTVNSSGNVGIGSVAPEGLLEVQGAEATSAAFYLDADDGDDVTDTWILQSVAANNYFSITNGVTTLVNITSGGFVGIGSAAPEGLLEVQGAEATAAAIYLDADDGDDVADTWIMQSLTTNSFTLTNGATEVLALSSGGNLQIDGTMNIGSTLTVTTNTAVGADPLCWDGSGASLYGDCTSLGKYKANREDLDIGLEEILQLQPRTFDWKRHNDGTLAVDNPDFYVADIGFIAEEVEAVSPWFGKYDYDTNELTGIRERGILAATVRATQELFGVITENATQLTALSQQLGQLNVTTSTPSIPEFAVTQSATFYGTLTVIGEASFESRVVFEKEVEFQDHIKVDADTAGSVVIEEGEDEIEVSFERPYQQTPRIVATLQTLEDVRYAVTDKTVDGFTISLLDDAPADLTFDWIALASDDPEQDEPTSDVSNDPDSGATIIDVESPLTPDIETIPTVSNDPDSGDTIIDVSTPLISDGDLSSDGGDNGEASSNQVNENASQDSGDSSAQE